MSSGGQLSPTRNTGQIDLVGADNSNEDKSSGILTIISTTSVVTRIVPRQFKMPVDKCCLKGKISHAPHSDVELTYGQITLREVGETVRAISPLT